MAKPIPVFSFVFAAYFATSGTSGFISNPPPAKELQPNDPFSAAWRVRTSIEGVLQVKVGISPGARAGELRFMAQNSCEEHSAFWLDELVETPLGFIGAAMGSHDLPPRIKRGQRMRFQQSNVLEWRLGDRKSAHPAPQLPCDRRRPHEMLADLFEIVGS